MDDTPLWVFGYGSLIWNPGFEFEDRVLATLPGYWRSFCMWSIHHRGTQDRPGLVLALDVHDAAECRGIAFAVRPALKHQVLGYLRERELVSSAYLERTVTVGLRDGRRVEAVAYVVDNDHVQYCGGMDLERQARVIAGAVGDMGPNTEYLFNTQTHLEQLGIADADLHWLAERVRQLTQWTS